MLVAKACRIDDFRFDAMLLEKALGQEELRVEILLLGSIIDDGNPAWLPGSSLQDPLMLEHAQDGGIEVIVS